MRNDRLPTARPAAPWAAALLPVIALVVAATVGHAAPVTAFDAVSYEVSATADVATDAASHPAQPLPLDAYAHVHYNNSIWTPVNDTADATATAHAQAGALGSTTDASGQLVAATAVATFVGRLDNPAFNQLTVSYDLVYSVLGDVDLGPGTAKFSGASTTVAIDIYDAADPTHSYGSGSFTYGDTACYPGYFGIPVCSSPNSGSDHQAVTALFPAGAPVELRVKLTDNAYTTWGGTHGSTSSSLTFAVDGATVPRPPAAVPEPSSAALLALPAGLLLRRRR